MTMPKEWSCEKCGHLNRPKFGHQAIRSLATLRERFEAKVAQAGPAECWLWKGVVNTTGYGMLYVAGRRVLAHRVAYELHHGLIPPGHEVLHSCDNPPCVNWGHLRSGTHGENIADAMAKGRHRPPGLGLKGQKNPHAKLTDLQAAEIRSSYRYRTPGHQLQDLALKYGVGRATIHNILNGRRYA